MKQNYSSSASGIASSAVGWAFSGKSLALLGGRGLWGAGDAGSIVGFSELRAKKAVYWFQKDSGPDLASCTGSSPAGMLGGVWLGAPDKRGGTGGSWGRGRVTLGWLLSQTWVLMWTFKFPCVVKARSHIVQEKGFSSVWILSWTCKALTEENVF